MYIYSPDGDSGLVELTGRLSELESELDRLRDSLSSAGNLRSQDSVGKILLMSLSSIPVGVSRVG
jgi:hypothetical protein